MRTIAFVTVVVLTGWVTALAQQPPSPANEPAHKIYVMSGCLQMGSSAAIFELTGAEHIGTPPPGSSETASPSATARSKSAAAYELQPVSNFGEQGISRDRLKSHVGKRVEVTVRPVEVPLAPSSAPRAPDRADTPEPKQPMPQRYTVVNISQLAESCQ